VGEGEAQDPEDGARHRRDRAQHRGPNSLFKAPAVS